MRGTRVPSRGEAKTTALRSAGVIVHGTWQSAITQFSREAPERRRQPGSCEALRLRPSRKQRIVFASKFTLTLREQPRERGAGFRLRVMEDTVEVSQWFHGARAVEALRSTHRDAWNSRRVVRCAAAGRVEPAVGEPKRQLATRGPHTAGPSRIGEIETGGTMETALRRTDCLLSGSALFARQSDRFQRYRAYSC